MPLVGSVGSRRPRARLAMALLYLALAAGAATTLFPFLMMASTGFKGPTDQDDHRLVPAYFFDSGQPEKVDPKSGGLYSKYVMDKYASDLSLIASTRIGTEAGPEAVGAYEGFLMSLPADHWSVGFRTPANQVVSRLTVRYQSWLRERFAGDIDALNKTYIEENTTFASISAPTEMLDRPRWSPAPGRKYADWLVFKATLPAEYRIPMRATRMYQEFLRGKFQNQFADVPKEVAGGAKRFEEVVLPANGPHLEEFQAKALPARYRDSAVESLWAKDHGGEMPVEAFERAHVREHAASIKAEFAGRNYSYVLDYILLHGTALWNTVLFCLLAIAAQLIVNPLAAYALSRYPMPATGKILLFLLATMAFPAEVAMIPSFLLLKGLGLLNTFAALVLPGAASGYMIFLLKGFFDSLPQELFEAGQIDGAKESTMLARIALPLSRPVLGYLALLAFMGAYGSFLYAFLVAQDRRIWTLMVWIYELQILAPRSVVMAALTLAAIPTLIVFLAAQKVIMRGIVLPGEK